MQPCQLDGMLNWYLLLDRYIILDSEDGFSYYDAGRRVVTTSNGLKEGTWRGLDSTKAYPTMTHRHVGPQVCDMEESVEYSITEHTDKL